MLRNALRLLFRYSILLILKDARTSIAEFGRIP